MDSRQFIATIPELAHEHLKLCRSVFGEELSHTEESLARLDGIIDAEWPAGPPAVLEPVLITFGSFVGETIRRLHGGEWKYSDELGYYLDGVGDIDLKVFPFDTVRKRFVEGAGDSIGDHYAGIKDLIRRERGTSGTFTERGPDERG